MNNEQIEPQTNRNYKDSVFVDLFAHDETENLVPEYYKAFINHLLENGITFDEPEFI